MSDRSGGTGQPFITELVADQAGMWDARLRLPECAEVDRQRFAVWRDAHPAHRAAFEKLQASVATFRHERGRADVRALRDEALRAIGKRRRERIWLTSAAASVLAIGLCLGFLRAQADEWPPWRDLFATLAGTDIYATGVGERSSFVLPDGSLAELNAQSRIEVSFNEARRNVELVNGEAVFNVIRSERRPFVVRAGGRQVVAVGTQFDVRVDPQSLRVTLIEGKVRVEAIGSAREYLAGTREGDAVMLTPGKQLVATRVSPDDAGRGAYVNVVRNIDVRKVTAWREGRVFLEDQPLIAAVVEMNRHSTVQIKIEGLGLAQLRVNGMFRAGEQEAFVAALEEYFPMISVIHRGDDEIVLTMRR